MSSYYTDLDNDRGADYEVAVMEIEDDIKNNMWRTEGGKAIAIKDMGTRHVRNTIRMINRNQKTYEDESENYLELRNTQRDMLEEELERRKGQPKRKPVGKTINL